MKARATQLMEFLRRSDQFAVPIYQRSYSWTVAECQQLWDDILRTGRDENISSHFLGSIVYIEKGQYQISGHSPMLVIDGQQRLATVSLIIEALARALGNEEPLDGFTTKELRDDYLLNPTKKNERRYKLLLSQTDKRTLMDLVDQKVSSSDFSLRLQHNFEFFQKEINKLNKDFLPLCVGLLKLMIVDIALSRGDDNPQLIFESMNSTGLGLSQADLIRNYILMGLEPDEQNSLYNSYWRPMEEAFGQEAYAKEFDSFMRYYLAVKNRDLPNIGNVYREFKIFAQAYTAEYSIESLLNDIFSFAGYYCAIALGKERNTNLLRAFEDLRELKASISYPLLLEFYRDYSKNLIDEEGLLKVVRLVECYVFRRAVCDIPTNSMNKTFASFAKNIDQEHYVESVEANFLLLESYRRLPSDEEFYSRFISRNIYNFQRCAYLLRKLENYMRKELVSINEYTIEHIMPQNENLSSEWRLALGPDWQIIQSKYLHTLGNLTLTGYNSEYSDKPFSEKRDMKGGFSESPLKLNSDIGIMSDWNEITIKNRADRLAKVAWNVWSYPSLEQEKANKYHTSKSLKKAEYSVSAETETAVKPINSNSLIDPEGELYDIFAANSSELTEFVQRLLRWELSAIFTVIHREIMNLDPCVVEALRKYYVTYSSEKIFSSVEARSFGLRVYFYMPISELHDSEGITEQVPESFNFGKAEAMLTLNEPDEIPYVMSLVRQAFRYQMENED